MNKSGPFSISTGKKIHQCFSEETNWPFFLPDIPIWFWGKHREPSFWTASLYIIFHCVGLQPVKTWVILRQVQFIVPLPARCFYPAQVHINCRLYYRGCSTFTSGECQPERPCCDKISRIRISCQCYWAWAQLSWSPDHFNPNRHIVSTFLIVKWHF